MRDLIVTVPSRGRPESAQRLAESFFTTCVADTEMVLGLDSDDPLLKDYPAGTTKVIKSDIRNVVPWMNELAVSFADSAKYIGLLGDDNVPRTNGWDEQIIEALGKTPFAFGNDLYPREAGSHACHLFCRSEIIKALGYLGPPTIKHMFVDNVWTEWGNACGITYLHNVIIEHLHFTTGKSSYDDTYKLGVDLWDTDKSAFDEYMSSQFTIDIDKIKSVL